MGMWRIVLSEDIGECQCSPHPSPCACASCVLQSRHLACVIFRIECWTQQGQGEGMGPLYSTNIPVAIVSLAVQFWTCPFATNTDPHFTVCEPLVLFYNCHVSGGGRLPNLWSGGPKDILCSPISWLACVYPWCLEHLSRMEPCKFRSRRSPQSDIFGSFGKWGERPGLGAP